MATSAGSQPCSRHEEYAIREAQALEQQRLLDLQRKLEQDQTKDSADASALANESLINLNMAKEAVLYSTNNPDSNLTGIMGVAKSLADNLPGMRMQQGVLS